MRVRAKAVTKTQSSSIRPQPSASVAPGSEAAPGVEPVWVAAEREMAVSGAGPEAAAPVVSAEAAPVHLTEAMASLADLAPIETALLQPTFPEEVEEDVAERLTAEKIIVVAEGAPEETEILIVTETAPAAEAETEAETQTAPEAEAQPAPVCQGRPYTVRRGDSFQLIARRFGVTMRDLLAANQDLHPGRLMVGDVLCIPDGSGETALPAPAAPAEPVSPVPQAPVTKGGAVQHQVANGESIVDILVLGNVSLGAFQAANPRLRFGHQRVGDWVRMPPAGSRGALPGGTAYQITESLPLNELATRLGVSTGALLRANSHLLPGDFQAGQVICVPNVRL